LGRWRWCKSPIFLDTIGSELTFTSALPTVTRMAAVHQHTNQVAARRLAGVVASTHQRLVTILHPHQETMVTSLHLVASEATTRRLLVDSQRLQRHTLRRRLVETMDLGTISTIVDVQANWVSLARSGRKALLLEYRTRCKG